MSTTANLQIEIVNFGDTDFILQEFSKSIFDNVFYRNRQFLRLSSDIVKFEKNIWEYNPQQFCLDQYSIVHIYPIILLINNLKSLFEFTSEKLNYQIYAPTKSSIISILTFTKI
jgi:hypothetical protein